MKIVIKQLPKSTIEDFADEHDLTMVVDERSEKSNLNNSFFLKYTASFEGAEDKCDLSSGILSSSYGNGSSPDQAIYSYADKISGRVLIFNATSKENRKEIQCPIFIR